MPKHIRTKRQARSEKNALRKLKAAGLYSGKLDLRRSATKYQRQIISKYKDVTSGKSAVVKPANPKSYRSIFKTIGDKVIVPRRKGERITVNKKGEIEGVRRIKTRKGSRTVHSKLGMGKPKRGGKGVQYAVPFKSFGGDVRWLRFPNFDRLEKYMAGYNPYVRGDGSKTYYRDWEMYVLTERIGADEKEDADETLTDRLDSKMDRILRRKLRK